jgi:hypothetical protein
LTNVPVEHHGDPVRAIFDMNNEVLSRSDLALMHHFMLLGLGDIASVLAFQDVRGRFSLASRIARFVLE